MLGLSITAHANQKATLSCTGSNIVLEERSPYMGENSKLAQSLFVLKSKSENDNETRDTAYFLNIFEEGATGRTIYTGKNEVGGFFQLDVSSFTDIGDGTVIQEIAKGYLDYNHGSLKGTREKVTCSRQ